MVLSRCADVGPLRFGKALAIKYRILWEKGDEKRTRNVFNCKHYNRAQTQIKQQFPKAAPDDAKETLRGITANATKVWDKHNP